MAFIRLLFRDSDKWLYLCRFDYVYSKSNGRVIVWGHSLGAGVSSHMAALVSMQGTPPRHLILESPFNNLKDEIQFHPLSSVSFPVERP